MEEVFSGGFQTRTEGPCKRDAYNSAKTITKSQRFFSWNIVPNDGRIQKSTKYRHPSPSSLLKLPSVSGKRPSFSLPPSWLSALQTD